MEIGFGKDFFFLLLFFFNTYTVKCVHIKRLGYNFFVRTDFFMLFNVVVFKEKKHRSV